MPEPPQNVPDANASACSAENAGGGVSLFLRLWAYGGPLQPLSTLAFNREPEIVELIRGIVRNPAAVIPEHAPQLFSVRFENVLDAASSAKAVQQRFLRYRRRTQPNQVIPTILICSSQNAAISLNDEAGTATLTDILARENAGQILVCGGVFASIKASPGLQFNSKPVREAGPSGSPEALYELLWTDESTYGHLRNAILTRQTVGRYEIQHELGRGAMAAVYKAHDQVIGRTVALKVISLDLNTPDRADIMERLKREAQAAGKLDHPNIITIYDVGQETDVVYLSMQFLQGKTLLTYLSHTGAPALSTLISWADQICGAVGFAHSHGVIHRDLKPANLMLTDQGVIKVLDFGIAKIENATLTQTGLVVGTPSYMSPEQVAGKKIDHRTDIFSLGAVFYELVTREKPFRGDVASILYKIVNEDPPAPSIINPALPGGIDAIIRKALAKNPNERFQTCEEMRKAFLEHAAQLSITAPASLPLSAAAKDSEPHSSAANDLLAELLEETAPRQRRRIWPAVVAVLALALAASATWAFYKAPGSSLLPATARKAIASMRGSLAARFSRAMTATKSSVVQSQPVDSDDPAQYVSSENRDVAGKNAGNESPASPDSPTPVHPDPDSTIKSAPPSTQATVSSANTELSKDANHASSAVAESAIPGAQQPSVSDTAAAQSSAALQAATKNPTAPETNAASTNSRPAKLAVASSNDQPPIVAPVVATKTQKPRREAALTVDGFTRHDVPELLREAETAAGRGDYRLAIYSYNLILKLDPANSSAKAGLRRVQAAQQSQ